MNALTAIEMADPDPLRLAMFDCSDWGNARRLVELAGGKLKWVEDLQAWAHYDGTRWSVERGNIEAQLLAQAVIRHIDLELRELSAVRDNEELLKKLFGAGYTSELAKGRINELRGHAVKSGSAGMTSGMLKQARPLLAAVLEDFDRDPLAYNVANCTLRFVQEQGRWVVKASAHDPADMLMHIANVDYEEGAECPFWRKRLALLTPDTEQLAAFSRLYGCTLTGLTSDQAFYVHQGKGGDGKSATHMALADLHGDYYRHAGVKTFLEGADRGGAEHRSDLVRLRGDVRFVTCDEPKARAVWDGAVIKQITGSLVTARGSGERTEVTYKPRFKLHTECNVIPRAPSDDKGFRRRFKLYQWKVSLSDTEEGEMPIDQVLEQLADEKPGILNWLIEGALHWLETREIPQPKAMQEVLSDFWADSSPLLEWMSEWCDTSDPEARTRSSALYDHFKKWNEDAGREHVMSSNAFGRALLNKQFKSVKDRTGARWRKGIKLREQGIFGDFVGDAPTAPSGSGEEQPAVSGRDPFDPDADDELARP
jgi:putative DNA primase/helicase